MEVGSEDLALRYLRGETLRAGRLENREIPVKGWVLVTTGGMSLGFAKAAGGMLKTTIRRDLESRAAEYRSQQIYEDTLKICL